MRALRVDRQDFLSGILKNQNPLATDRDDDKTVFLQFGHFLSGQTSGTDRPGAGKRFKITDYWVQNASQPAHSAQAQKKV